MALATPGGPGRPHHITRIDIEPSERYPHRHPTHGWQVRARTGGRRLSKFFADAKHSGTDAALRAAIAYRDALLASLPDPAAMPRKAWSNTGVVGLSVREKDEAGRTKLYVQLNWVNADGKRRASSFSVDKWGLRRALWNGCVRLHEEREAAGAAVEEPHVMFARAQKPFAELIEREIAEEQRAEREKAAEERYYAELATPEGQMRVEKQRMDALESALFGR